MFVSIIASVNLTRLELLETSGQAPESSLGTRYYGVDFQSGRLHVYNSQLTVGWLFIEIRWDSNCICMNGVEYSASVLHETGDSLTGSRPLTMVVL